MRTAIPWRTGTDAEVAWINQGTSPNMTVTAAIPPVFDACATIVLPGNGEDQQRHNRAMLALLASQPAGQRQWLGCLSTSDDDMVCPGVTMAAMPKVTMYPGWQYVLVEAGPGQAAAWRGKNTGSMWWHDVLPDLMFPAGRSWLVSALCDDGWACIGGPAGLVDRILVHRTCRHGHCSPAKTPPRQATTRSDPRADSRSRPTRSPAMAANRRPPTA